MTSRVHPPFADNKNPHSPNHTLNRFQRDYEVHLSIFSEAKLRAFEITAIDLGLRSISISRVYATLDPCMARFQRSLALCSSLISYGHRHPRHRSQLVEFCGEIHTR
ncbi:hypothetical protein IHE45_10G065000 [Dioscorea alata]|uniref:Uncharacterized protein n=1 Tax=Dioscorea alata TaxID=55571 RepID=A0ACB7VBL5_DIOAL|nr:hypothetical protein IHE45_10G065000 [Dioscorea alata]